MKKRHDDDAALVQTQHRELIEFLTNNDDMRKTAKNAFKQAMYAGGGAVGGSILLGPVGGLVGGIAGSVLGYRKADNYDGALKQLNELDEPRKQQVIKSIGIILLEAGATAVELNTAPGFRGALVTYALVPYVRSKIWKACDGALR